MDIKNEKYTMFYDFMLEDLTNLGDKHFETWEFSSQCQQQLHESQQFSPIFYLNLLTPVSRHNSKPAQPKL